MAKRRYEQYCALARALDVLGERWTLLVIRELLLGPKRYSDLLDALPGIGTNLLAARLKELEENGIVKRRRLPPPAASSVYELTADGRELEAAVIALTRWGSSRLGRPKPGEHFRPAWLAIAMQAAFRPEAAKGVSESYEFRVDDEVLHVRVEQGTARVSQEPAHEPDLTFTTDSRGFVALMSGQMMPMEAVRRGKAKIEGDPGALTRCLEIFGLATGEPVAG